MTEGLEGDGKYKIIGGLNDDEEKEKIANVLNLPGLKLEMITSEVLKAAIGLAAKDYQRERSIGEGKILSIDDETILRDIRNPIIEIVIERLLESEANEYPEAEIRWKVIEMVDDVIKEIKR